MATMTTKQIQTINSKCSNGFRFDIVKFQYRGDKDLFKSISISDTKMIKATLYFMEEHKNYSSTGFQIPTLHVSVWVKTGDAATWSSGLGKFRYFNDNKTNRRNMSILQDVTALITDEMIHNLAVDNRNESVFNSFPTPSVH